MRLLHLEDNLKDAELIHFQVKAKWPDCEIRRVDTRTDFLAAVGRDDFDLILSDFSLPAFNGLEALGIARQQRPATPFVFLSGTIGEDNAVQALQRGATDYVIKDRPARLIPAMERALAQRREFLLRQEAEQQLREQAGLLDKARDAICVADIDGRVTYWNQSAARLFGWTAGEGREHRLQELFGWMGQARLPEALKRLHATGAWNGDLRFLGRDHAFRDVESRWTLVHGPDGQPKSILVISTDTTEHKKLESQLLRSQRMEGIGTLA
ncbi:MAG: PAS domain-containing protein, partial [Pseudomonadota bacterium]